MKLIHLIESSNLIQLAKNIGNDMFGKSHSGLVFKDKITHMSYNDYIARDDSGCIGTYDFIFFPSTKTGVDASDEPFDESHVDSDGKIYVAGADGVFVLSDTFTVTQGESQFPDKEFKAFENAIKKVYPKVKIEKSINQHGQLFVNVDGKMVGQFIVEPKNVIRWLVSDVNYKTISKYNWY